MKLIERILFASPYCLLDRTSGAAISMTELLTNLTHHGLECEAVMASVFDPNREVLLDEVLQRQGSFSEISEGKEEGIPFTEVSQGKLKHTILKTLSSRRLLLRNDEEEALLRLVERKMDQFQPDVLLTYGGLSAERGIHRLAHQRGIPVVFYLVNNFYKKAETFSDIDLILVPSQYLADYYKQRLGIESQILRDIISRERYFVAHRHPRFITFINPVPQKGLTLFARLLSESLRQIPRAEFLVVEGRWTQADVAQVGLKLHRTPSVKVLPNQADMRLIYAVTKILLFPSFREEASGRSIIEAQINGIPILASQSGGIPENLNGGGFLFKVPERCTQNYMAVPTPEEVQPWMDQLRRLLEDEEAYEEAQNRALQASQDFSPDTIVQRAIKLFQDLANH